MLGSVKLATPFPMRVTLGEYVVISIRKLLVGLLSIVVLLVLMHFFTGKAPSILHDRFDLDAEANIPTWFSTVLLFAVSMSSFRIFQLSPEDRPSRNFWLFSAGVYAFLSLDESARFHEIIDHTVKWVYVYAPLGFAFFVACACYFIRVQPSSLRNWILGGMIVYALGGLGGEFASYWFRPLPQGLQQAEFVFEEGLEMIGSILVLMGCLTELHRLSPPETMKRASP